MKYMKPEIEMIELDAIDVIKTSVTGDEETNEGPTQGENETPWG